MIDAEDVEMVNGTVVNSLGLDPANVRSVFVGAESIEVDYVNPEEPKEVEIDVLMGAVRWALQFLELSHVEPSAFYFSPRLIKVRTVDHEYTFTGRTDEA